MPIQPKQQPPYYEPATTPTPTVQPTQYIALLTQTGTNAPTATTLINTTTDQTPVWTRTNTGRYTLTMTGVFTANKTTIILGQTNEGGIGVFQTSTNDVNSILVNTDDFTFSGADDLLLNTPIIITIYP